MQKKLGIHDENRTLPTVCLSTGALGALENIFRKVVASYKASPPKTYNVVIDSKVNDVNYPVFQPNFPMAELKSRPGPLIDQCMAYDLLITRAGGGAVNAAISSACPWVSIMEPLHPQVNAIAQSARKMGLTRCIPYEVFEHDPCRIIERELIDSELENRKIISKLYELSSQAEIRFADGVLREFL
jgi:UDP-N-acetylglucosamine:LPS N-acetylglucosamine transferase